MKSPCWKSERGSSLVEVLVVMVVLVVGIFSIIRIFPIGFDILEYTGNASVAHRLAEGEVEFWRNKAVNLPDGIVGILPSAATRYQIDPTVRPNDFLSGSGAPGDNSNLQQTILSLLQSTKQIPAGTDPQDVVNGWVGAERQRRVLGEVTPIPVPSPLTHSVDAAASIYSLAYAPIDWPTTGNPASATVADQYLQIRGNSLSSVDCTGLKGAALNAEISTLLPLQFGIDYNQGIVYFNNSNQLRQFLATYTYLTPSGPKTVQDEPIVIQPSSSKFSFPQRALGVVTNGSSFFDSTFQGIEPGTEEVAPKFNYLASGTPFSTNPYEYKVLSQYAIGEEFSAAIAFNPLGYNQLITLPGGAIVPLKARIDYTVKDWRILHQDITLPSSPTNGTYNVRLALPNLQQAGQSSGENSLSPWAGLTSDIKDSISVAAVDLSSGNVALDSGGKANGFTVDYKNGVLFFPGNVITNTPFGTQSSEAAAGATFRIFYSVVGDWAVIPQKAYSAYNPVAANLVFTGSNKDKEIPIGQAILEKTPQSDSQGTYYRLLFPLTDEGKAVSFDVTYPTMGQNASVVLKTTSGQELQISSEDRQSGGEPWYFKVNANDINEIPKPYVKIYLPADVNTSDISKIPSDFYVSNVRGTSFRAVTVWRDRDRWRYEAITTHLERAAS